MASFYNNISSDLLQKLFSTSVEERNHKGNQNSRSPMLSSARMLSQLTQGLAAVYEDVQILDSSLMNTPMTVDFDGESFLL